CLVVGPLVPAGHDTIAASTSLIRWFLCRRRTTASASCAPSAVANFRTVTVATAFLLQERSIDLWHELSPRQTLLIVVRVLARSVGELHPRVLDFLVRNQFEQLRDAVEARALLVVGPDDVPGGIARVGRLEHRVARARVVVPPLARWE